MSKEREYIPATSEELREMCAALERIRSKCEEAGNCWLWRGSMNGNGRTPCVWYQGKTQNVRKVVYILKHGKVRADRVVSPGCGHFLCVSPHCVKQCTISEARQIASKARNCYANPAKIAKVAMARRAKSNISDETVERIRASADSTRKLARETGISRSHIRAIKNGTARIDYTGNPFAGLFTGLVAANSGNVRRAA
jgi:hypothetical protein